MCAPSSMRFSAIELFDQHHGGLRAQGLHCLDPSFRRDLEDVSIRLGRPVRDSGTGIAQHPAEFRLRCGRIEDNDEATGSRRCSAPRTEGPV